MKRRIGLKGRYYRLRGKTGRAVRLLFPSPAEMKLVELMGGKVIRIKKIKWPTTHFPLAFVIKRPKLFKQNHVKREVRCGRFYADFANDVGWPIEVDGLDYHMDIVADLTREAYMIERGWRTPLRIPAHRLWREPDRVQRDVMKYLST